MEDLREYFACERCRTDIYAERPRKGIPIIYLNKMNGKPHTCEDFRNQEVEIAAYVKGPTIRRWAG